MKHTLTRKLFSVLCALALVLSLVPTGLDGGWLLWNQRKWTKDGIINNGLSYARYSADGSVGECKTLSDIALSDCQPIVYNGKAVWYTTHDSAPVFYTLDASGVSSNPDGSFKPENNVTTPQFLAMMVRIFYKDEPSAVTTPAGEPWYYAANKVAEDTKLSWGLLVEDGPIYRFDMATVIDNYLNHSGAARKISDQKILENCALLNARDGKQPVNEAISDWAFVARCMAAGIITGKDDGLFHGEQFMTRAEACVVINRLRDFVNS